jgi:hypothetical protein
MNCPSHPPLFEHFKCTWQRVKLTKRPIMQHSYLPTLHLSSASNTLSLFSSFNVRDQVLRPYRTTGKITVMCILFLLS